ncbi:MAG: hypothetical protein EBY44_06695, partial [Actinobacteria bacterium]|nr:hypothetical protein [Actinomycetota bacterium]
MSRSANRGSLLVGAGIFLSRIAGLLREMVSGRVLGNSAAADALVTALRIPNLLQNLLGEGVLSASFVPVYSDALEHDDRREASRVAGAVGALLMTFTAGAVLVMKQWYDNTSNNPNVTDPDQFVVWGSRTGD